ncbi:hypothetical protein WDW37_06040 [Bdellovibrionota bacterium FG-1]
MLLFSGYTHLFEYYGIIKSQSIQALPIQSDPLSLAMDFYWGLGIDVFIFLFLGAFVRILFFLLLRICALEFIRYFCG